MAPGKLVHTLKLRTAVNTEGVTWDHSTSTTPEAAITIIEGLIRHEPVEVSGVLLLNHRKQVIGWHELGRGSASMTQMPPEQIAKVALLANASAVIIAHNHPTEIGTVSPSDQDFIATYGVQLAVRNLSIDVLDHLVVGCDQTASLIHNPTPEVEQQCWRVFAMCASRELQTLKQYAHKCAAAAAINTKTDQPTAEAVLKAGLLAALIGRPGAFKGIALAILGGDEEEEE